MPNESEKNQEKCLTQAEVSQLLQERIAQERRRYEGLLSQQKAAREQAEAALRERENTLRERDEQLRARMSNALAAAGEAASAQARQAVPLGDGRDGGHLRDCIAAESGFSGDCGWMQVTARNPHAAAVELGTSRMRARPYLLPALRAQAAGFLQAIRK